MVKKLILFGMLFAMTACSSQYSWTPDCYIENSARPASCGPCVHEHDAGGNAITANDTGALFCKKPDNL